MPAIKKLIFAPVFLIFIASALYFYQPILNQYLEIFFKPYGGLIEFGTLAIFILFASLTFSLYITFTQDFKYALVLAVLASLLPFAFLRVNLAIVIGICLFISLILTYFNLQTNLRTYVNFLPTTLLLTPIKMLNTFILLTLAVGFYLNANSIIQTQGFKIPEQIIDWSIDLSLQNQNPPVLGKKYLAQLPTLTQEQLDLLKANPQVLEQFGLDPKDLDQYTPDNNPQNIKSPNQNAVSVTPSIPGANLKDIIKAQISDSLDRTIKPYLFAIPIILAFMFYSFASLILWILSLFLSPIISLIFLIFEKTGFIRFEKEMREVKKIVI